MYVHSVNGIVSPLNSPSDMSMRHSRESTNSDIPLNDVWNGLRAEVAVFAPQFDDFGSVNGSQCIWTNRGSCDLPTAHCDSPLHALDIRADLTTDRVADEYLLRSWDAGETHHVCIVDSDSGDSSSSHWVMWQRVNDHVVSTKIDLEPVLTALTQLNDHRAALARATTRRARAVERERISRELHDIAVQQLYATRLRLSALAVSTHAPITDQLTSIGEAIDDVISAIRQEILANGGLETSLAYAQLDAIASSILMPYGCAYDLVVDTEIDTRLLAHVRAVVTEAASNAARHGLASMVWIRVSNIDNRLRVTVADNGTGHDAPASVNTPASGNGIKNMTARAALCGGTCTLSPRQRGGTVVMWEAPMKGEHS